MIYYLSLGSNIGDREATLLRATTLIDERIGHVTRRSSFYYSAPWGFESDHPFCNICLAVETALQPLEVLRLTQKIEHELGRREKTLTDNMHHPLDSYHDRAIDIDLLCCFDGDREITWPPASSTTPQSTSLKTSSTISSSEMEGGELILPHPLMRERGELLLPHPLMRERGELLLPHPLMRERDFVMTPLREICPERYIAL